MTIEALNASFRTLVKKYHPDRLREYPEWAHERMAEINDAYETLMEMITKKSISEEETPPPSWEKAPEKKPQPPSPAPSFHVSQDLAAGMGYFLDGLSLYYQYGLENPDYRKEGTRRFRYREALRLSKSGQEKLQSINKEEAAREQREAVKIAQRFVSLSVTTMGPRGQLRTQKLLPLPLERKFHQACRVFDAAVKEIFFPDLIPGHMRGRFTAGLYNSYAIFVLLLTTSPKGEQRNTAVLWTARYDALLALLELKEKGYFSW